MTMISLRRVLLTATFILAGGIVLIAGGQDQRDDDNGGPAVRLLFRDRPSLRVAKILRVDLRTKIQGDFRTLSPDFTIAEGSFDLARARLVLEGDFLRHVGYHLERELRETFGGLKAKYPWRDVYFNIDYLEHFQVQGGKFKIPFSIEQTTSASNLDFVKRARIADDLAPARDIGIMLHGLFFNRGFGYEAGVFRGDGENSESLDNVRGQRAYALRLTGKPLRPLRLPADLGKIEI